MSFIYRQCCTDGPASEHGAFLEPVDSQGLGLGPVLSVVRAEDEKPVRSVAYHEAAHAVVAFSLGLEVGEVVARNGGWATISGGSDRDWPGLIVLAAGDFGGDIPARHTHRPTDETLVPWIAAVRACKMGFCDRCRIIRALVARTGHGPDRGVLDEYRRLEIDILDILGHPMIRAAIRALAGELIQTGRLSADRVNELLKNHLERN